MSTWGFKGVDIDWKYPAAKDRNGRDEDYANYPAFLANLRAALDYYNYGLTPTLQKNAAVSTITWNNDQRISYDDEVT